MFPKVGFTNGFIMRQKKTETVKYGEEEQWVNHKATNGQAGEHYRFF